MTQRLYKECFCVFVFQITLSDCPFTGLYSLVDMNCSYHLHTGFVMFLSCLCFSFWQSWRVFLPEPHLSRITIICLLKGLPRRLLVSLAHDSCSKQQFIFDVHDFASQYSRHIFLSIFLTSVVLSESIILSVYCTSDWISLSFFVTSDFPLIFVLAFWKTLLVCLVLSWFFVSCVFRCTLPVLRSVEKLFCQLISVYVWRNLLLFRRRFVFQPIQHNLVTAIIICDSIFRRIQEQNKVVP